MNWISGLSGTGLDHCHVPHPRAGILDYRRREDHAVADFTVARNLRTVAKHAVIENLGVMAHVLYCNMLLQGIIL